MIELKINPELRSLIPPLDADELKALEESILDEGIRDPIITWRGVIVDGGNRYDIATKHNLACPSKEKAFADLEEAKIWIKRNQLGRRNIPLLLKAEYLLAIKEWQEKRAQARENSQANLKQSATEIVNSQNRQNTTKDLAKALNIGEQKASHIIKIHEKAPKEIKDKCLKGEISINKAYKEVKKIESQEKINPQEITQAAFKMPTGKYRTIVIDPPCLRDESEEEAEGSTPDYPAMSLDEIRKLPIKDIADKDCHLYLWTTHSSLPEALDILKSWGFKYQCLLTWVKNIGSTSNSWTYSTEHCLFGWKMHFECNKAGIRTDFSADVRDHSLKPEIFYEIVKSASSEPRIDLFSREPHEGFTAWDPRSENPG